MTTDTMLDLRPPSKPALTAGNVLAVWLQNFGGGIGAATITALACWGFAADALTALRWSLTIGGLVFGALMILRSAIDEIVDAADYRTMIADMEDLEEQNDLLEQRCAALQRDLHAAETFGAYRAARPGVIVQDRNGDPMPAPAPTPIRNDAKTLIQLHFEAGVWPAKDASCQKLGWTTTRWAEARDELQRHRIVATQGKRTVVLVASLAEALAVLAGDTSSR